MSKYGESDAVMQIMKDAGDVEWLEVRRTKEGNHNMGHLRYVTADCYDESHALMIHQKEIHQPSHDNEFLLRPAVFLDRCRC